MQSGIGFYIGIFHIGDIAVQLCNDHFIDIQVIQVEIDIDLFEQRFQVAGIGDHLYMVFFAVFGNAYSEVAVGKDIPAHTVHHYLIDGLQGFAVTGIHGGLLAIIIRNAHLPVVENDQVVIGRLVIYPYLIVFFIIEPAVGHDVLFQQLHLLGLGKAAFQALRVGHFVGKLLFDPVDIRDRRIAALGPRGKGKRYECQKAD